MKFRIPPHWPLAALLVVFTAALYWPTVGYEFVGVDDPEFVTDNAHVRNGLTGDGMRWAFTSAHAANWIPLTWISLMLDASGGGEPDPARFHRTNVLLHALGTLLLFVALWRSTQARWASLWVAALFALHPLRVESVAWVAERKDVLSGVFWFGCLTAYAQWAMSRRRRWYVLTCLMLALGLLAKAMLVTLPAVLLLWDAWPLRRTEPWSRRLREKLPLFVMVLAMSVATFVAQRGAGAVSDLSRLGGIDRGTNAIVAYARYVQMTLWPHPLSYLYLHPSLRGDHGWAWPTVVGCLAGLAAATALLVVVARRRGFRPPLVGWLWYLGTLVPVIGLVQVGSQSVADRYTYLPQIGLWIALAWSLRAVVARKPVLRAPMAIAAMVILVPLVAKTHRQLPVWKDSASLFRHAVEVDDRNYYALNGLGTSLARAGDTGGAVRMLQRALEVRPTMSEALVNLGNVHTMQKQFDAAITRYQEALRIEPDSPQAHLNLANCYLVKQQFDDAQRHYEAVLRFEPGAWQAFASLARIQASRGQWDQAIRLLESAIRLRPADARLRAQLDEVRRARN